MKRIDKLTPEQEARFDEWADRWIEIGLRTGPADREKYARAVEQAYGYAGLEWHGRIVWVPSPFVMAIAAPTAAYILALHKRGAVDGAVDGAVRGAVRDAVDGAVDGAVRGAVHDAVDGAVRGAVRGAVDGAVRGAVRDAVDGAVDGAVRGAVHDAVRGAVRDAVDDAVGGVWRTIKQAWPNHIGGQFWVGGWWWGGAWTSYFREVAGLELPGDLWARALTYEATLESACWWWPHRDFVMVCERPSAIHREQVGPRGWGSHRLHCEDGPAVVWPDGWGVYAWHGTRVPADVILHPERLDAARVLTEPNAEVRRAMCERMGWDRFVELADLREVDRCPDPANPGFDLALFDLPTQIFEEPVRLVLCTNASPERDGTRRRFGLTCPADTPDALSAVAWTFDLDKTTYAGLARAT